MLSRLFKLIFMLLLFILAAYLTLVFGCSQSSTADNNGVAKFELDNGMQVILKENHSSPMVTSLIFVRAGAKFEDRFNNGATHFLEHLLFNGTATQTQEQLDRGIERLGGYINAFTRKEFTAYLVSMPRDYIDYGMATQADMLFNSIFPDDKYEKERGIVIEEIRKDADAESAPAEAFFEEMAMKGTAYNQPIIGYESIITNIPREAIIDYYKSFYAPNNMTALIIGDFEGTRMEKSMRSIFGPFPRVETPQPSQTAYRPLNGKEIQRISAGTESTYIKYSIEAPHYSDSDYCAFNLIEDFLADRENSPLQAILKSGPEPLVSSISAYLDTKHEFSRLNLDLITEKESMVDSIIALIDMTLDSLGEKFNSEELLDGYKVSRRADEIYMSEKLHYYGFTLAPLMAVIGWDAFSKMPDKIDSVTLSDIERACDDYLSEPAYIATVVTPAMDAVDIYEPSGPTVEEVNAYFASMDYPEYDLTAGGDFRMPEIKKVRTAGTERADYLKKVLDNGLTVVVKSNPDSRVFALNVIGKNRSATEPERKDGITDFVNRMIEKGTVSRDAETLSRELSSIGANVTLFDNPWIPYDDRYTTRQFSFMKFETIDKFTEKGLRLFADMIINPAFDSVEVEKVRQELFGLLGRNSGSTYKTARNKFYAALFEGTAYGKTIDGNYRTVGSITIGDLKEHHDRMYSPENMIITIGTNFPADSVMTMAEKIFGTMSKTTFEPISCERPSDLQQVKKAHEKMEKEQVYIYLGHLLPAANSPDAPGLKVANAILSKRLQNNLRERQSLAYSVGSSVILDKNFGWLICSIGTGVDNFEKARNGILGEIQGMKTNRPTEDELEEAVNSMWGSNLMAKLSRINQAYYMGVNEYLGLEYDYDDKYLDEIRKVTPEQVQQLAQKYFDTENYVIATAGNM